MLYIFNLKNIFFFNIKLQNFVNFFFILIMTIIDNNKCPNHICDGKIKIKYLSKNLDYKKINFSCTTDSYEKPSIYECSKCKIIFSEFIFQINKNHQKMNLRAPGTPQNQFFALLTQQININRARKKARDF